MTSAATVLLTASTGTVGRLVVPLLEARGVAVRRHDRSRPIGPQLRDVDTVFLACPNVAEQVAYECAVIDAAAAAGVDRLVKLSARGAALGSYVAFWDWHARIEAHLAGTGLPAVVLRPGFSMANLLGQLDTVRDQGALPLPGGDAPVAMIDPADIATVAALALLHEVPTGTHELTGPTAIGFAEVAPALAPLVGREVRYVDVPPAQAVPAMVAVGLPIFAAEQIANVFAALRAGGQSAVIPTVERLTGRAPGDLGQYLAAVRPAEVTVASS